MWCECGAAKKKGKKQKKSSPGCVWSIKKKKKKEKKISSLFCFGEFLFDFNFYISFREALFFFVKKNAADLRRVRGASVSLCVFMCVCVCARVGLRQNRAAEMRQALQIFVGWLTAPCLCQAPTAETTKRRIRLALEPQIFPPPPPHSSFSFLLLFSRSVARRLLWSGSDSIWQHSHPSANLSICLYFALIW